MAERAYTKTKSELKVLYESRRRCCLCFHLQNDLLEKKGQIAHINKNSSDSREANLAWLCLDHHDTYDSKSSQSKNYTQQELREAKRDLVKQMSSFNFPETAFITLQIENKGNALSEGELSLLTSKVASFVEHSDERLHVRRKSPTEEQFAISASDVERVSQAVDSGDLDEFKVSGIAIDRYTMKTTVSFHDGFTGKSVLKFSASKNQILDAFYRPDLSQHFLAGSVGNAANFTLTMRAKSYGTNDPYLLLVFGNTNCPEQVTIDTCVRFKKSTIHYDECSIPSELARKFFKLFGQHFDLGTGLQSFILNQNVPCHKYSSHTEFFGSTIESQVKRKYEYGYLVSEKVPEIYLPTRTVNVEYAYVLDTVKYVSYLRECKIPLPKRIVETFGPPGTL